uniref:Uncharacterized protein n=1 Tax=Meloidogyne floridensis TaxID=298350 RepID=A0A915NGH3_9BILA
MGGSTASIHNYNSSTINLKNVYVIIFNITEGNEQYNLNDGRLDNSNYEKTFDKKKKRKDKTSSHKSLNQGESSNPQFNHSSTGGFQTWTPPNETYEEPSSTYFNHSNTGGFHTWTHQDSTYEQPSQPSFNHSNSGGFQTWTPTTYEQPSTQHSTESTNEHPKQSFNHSRSGGFKLWKRRG